MIDPPAPTDARGAAERAARASYGRLLALLAAPTRDLALAEDALADAFEKALRLWPEQGVPGNPAGWLFTVARNRQRDVLASAARRTSAPLDPQEALMSNLGSLDAEALDAIPDRRLELLFVCAHPAIDPAIRTPLMLHTVLGVESAAIARAFHVPPAAMAQRLVRAKRRIRQAGIPFTVPVQTDMPHRLTAVLEAIYGAYAVAWRADATSDLAGEALYLAVTLARLLPHEPEAYGLAALIALSSARSDARLVDGRYVPLDEQDVGRWDAELVRFGERLLSTAHESGRPGRFQLEAAIQSAQVARLFGRRASDHQLLRLQRALVAIAPTLGARVALAAILGRVDGAEAGLRELQPVAPAASDFAPYWATRAHLLAAAGRPDEAAPAYERAIALTEDEAEQAWLRCRLTQLDQP